MVQNDEQIAAILATDLERHFQQFVVRYKQRLFGFAVRQVGNAQDAEQPEAALDGAERLRELTSLVFALPEPYREVINFYYFEDLNYREITELLNRPIGTVKRNNRCRRRVCPTESAGTYATRTTGNASGAGPRSYAGVRYSSLRATMD